MGYLLFLCQEVNILETHQEGGWAAQVALVIKNPPAMQETWDMGSIHGSGRSHGREQSNHCLENPMDKGAWWTIVIGLQRVEHDWSNLACTHAEGRSFYTSLLKDWNVGAGISRIVSAAAAAKSHQSCPTLWGTTKPQELRRGLPSLEATWLTSIVLQVLSSWLITPWTRSLLPTRTAMPSLSSDYWREKRDSRF